MTLARAPVRPKVAGRPLEMKTSQAQANYHRRSILKTAGEWRAGDRALGH